MGNYKDKLYEKYVSTHILHRKGEATLDEFARRAVVYGKQFGKFLPAEKNARIMDLGCGNGSVVWWLQKIGYSGACGIDLSEEQVRVARGLNVKNIEKSGIKEFLKDKERFYDIVFLRDVLEHFKKEEIMETLAICLNSLKEDGAVIIQVPNAESPFGGRLRYGDFTHEVAFTASSIAQVLNIAGFGRVYVYPSAYPVYGIKSFIRLCLWKPIELLYKFLIAVEAGTIRAIVTQNIVVFARK